MEHLPRMRTISAAYAMLKEDDPNTAVSMNYLRRIVLTGQIPVHQVGNKRLLNYDALLEFLENPVETVESDSQHGTIRRIR